MKTKIILSSALLAVACMAMIPTTTFARGGITVTDDDLILSLRATSGAGVNNNIEYDLGNISSITGSFSLNLSNDIGGTNNYFGGSNTGLLWSVVGTSYNNPQGSDATDNNLYYTVVNGGTPNPAPTALNGQHGVAGTLNNLNLGLNGQTSNTAASTKGFEFVVNPTNFPNGYTTLLTSNGADNAQSFGYFNTSVENSVGVSANLYENIEGQGSPELLGTFTLSNSDVLTFAPVPEPSTYILMGLGSLGLFVWARRRSYALLA
jgi:hypothetical protein